MRFRSQSAMEYLMTYGWAVLIIGVVLAALVSLGAFNSATWGPRASPGSCKVFRSTAITSLEGVCTSVIPQSVAQFNGQTSYVSTGTTGLPLGNNPRSAFAWIYWTGSLASSYPTIMEWGDQQIHARASGLRMNQPTGYLNFVGAGDDFLTTFIPTPNAWNFVGYTYSGGTSVTVYYDGQSQTGAVTQLNTVLGSTVPAAIGIPANQLGWYFPGSIADVQVYNTSLDANQVQALYMEGIGGVPVNLQYLVGWWPLNGDFNDYSGNGNTGTPASMAFTSSWTSGYTNP
jgi:hypothetical protein